MCIVPPDPPPPALSGSSRYGRYLQMQIKEHHHQGRNRRLQ